MIWNKFFNKQKNQKVIEDTIDKYYNAFKDEKIKETLSKMPKNKETLDTIEDILKDYVKDIDAPNEKMKWAKALQGIRNLEFMMQSSKKNVEEDKISVDSNEGE